MPQTAAHVTAAEISRIAGVTRATVSNWRRRHEDFPHPAGGTETSPLYDLEAVQTWLRARGHTQAADPREELRTAVRLQATNPARTAARMGFVLALARSTPDELTRLADLTDSELVAHGSSEMPALLASLPDAVPDDSAFPAADGDAVTLRALLRCVREEGGAAALSVLAERELEEDAATGVYGTPEPLARLVAGLIPADAAQILDPACGGGVLLAAAARQGAITLLGQDTVRVQAQRAAAGLRLAAPHAEITVRVGDSLRADAFADRTVDAVLCNPPYGDRDWGHGELAYDPRWAYGVPPRAESELAWAQHSLAHLTPGGWAALILPPATASRSSGRRVRAELVRSGALRAVMALPAGAAPPLHIGLQIWILRRPEPGGPERKSVLFVDLAGTTPPATSTGRTPLDWSGLTARAHAHWEAFTADQDGFTGEPGTAGAVPVVELLDDQVDLTPARRVRFSRKDVDPAALAARADTGSRELAEAARGLVAASARTGWGDAGASVRQWRTATVSDLARGGALTLLRTVPDTKEPRTGGATATSSGQAVLTGVDIARGTGPTGDPGELRADTTPVVITGDVLVRGIAGGTGPMARVADSGDADALLGPQVHLLRPDPARLDPWFLAGFIDSENNIAGASTGSTVLHIAPGRLRVPLMPLDEQRRYGEAFRRVHDLRARARHAARLAEETATLLAGGLTGGALLPPRAPAVGDADADGDPA
ncbi:N-6 DNA methylase [Streptomyces laurentii]|uniref:N-6 DNA methylase n=1 Tax=Streptomyces laurentii TaxID=39478 RepID=UPI0036C3B22F